jgi:hypothetical protein
MKTISVNLPGQVPLKHESQVIVIGGGPGGIGAAVAAARGGADVLLIEHYGFLGGMATAGEVNPFMPNHLDNQSLDTGIFEEWLDRMKPYGGVRGNTRIFDPCAARLAAEDLCLEAGVNLLYHHRTAHVQTADRRIETVVLHSKSGLTAARAKTYIDCTGDGDLAALAGCAFEYGGESGHAQPMTLCFKLKFDRNDLPDPQADPYPQFRAVEQQVQQVYSQAQADGRVECPRENVLTFRGVHDDVVHFNTTRVIQRKAIEGDELSDAEIQARRQLRQLIALFRAEIPIFAHCRLHSVASQIGIRESRRIRGRHYVTVEDYKAGRTFPDGVARVTYPIDIHNPTGTGTTLISPPKGSWYEIPWGCLLARDLDNLAIGSRCISVDHAVHSSVRVMPPVCSLGQAAGTGAAMALDQGVDICEVDGRALKAQLIAAGRNLIANPPKQTPKPQDPQAEQRRHELDEKVAKNYSA